MADGREVGGELGGLLPRDAKVDDDRLSFCGPDSVFRRESLSERKSPLLREIEKTTRTVRQEDVRGAEVAMHEGRLHGVKEAAAVGYLHRDRQCLLQSDARLSPSGKMEVQLQVEQEVHARRLQRDGIETQPQVQSRAAEHYLLDVDEVEQGAGGIERGDDRVRIDAGSHQLDDVGVVACKKEAEYFRLGYLQRMSAKPTHLSFSRSLSLSLFLCVCVDEAECTLTQSARGLRRFTATTCPLYFPQYTLPKAPSLTFVEII